MLDLLKAIAALLIVGGIISCAQKKVLAKKKSLFVSPIHSTVTIDPEIYKKISFVDNSKMAVPYLTMNIAFAPISDIRTNIEQKEKLNLVHRGEAHITVITPPEFERLRSVLSMELINEVALLNRIQETPFEIVCIGRGQIQENRKTLSTYFVVVDAPELLTMRHTIATLYKTHGGRPSEFDPDLFYPHITIGYTERDLHLQDGVAKDKSSCLIETQLKAQ